MKTILIILALGNPLFAVQVVLSWGAVSNPSCGPITAYNLYRADTSNGEILQSATGSNKIATVPATTLTYTDTNVGYGKTYYYKATATAAACTFPIPESVFSNEVVAVIPAQIILVGSPTLAPTKVVIP